MNFPSTTQVLNPWMDWSKIPPGNLQYAADRGVRVHELCTCYARSEFTIQQDPDCVPYLESFVKWYDLMVEDTILAEERFVDPVWLYSGQLDLLARLKDGRLCLCDIKTPLISQKSWRVQCASYWNLCKVNGHHPDCGGSLQLSPKGAMAKFTYYEETAADFNQFLQDLQSYRFYNS